jgi:hypothetical protein
VRIVSTAQLKRLSCVALLAAFGAMTAAPARAGTEAEQAEALIREGVRLRGTDNAARALPLFEQAYQLSRTPRTAAQLGLCELELGYFVATERYLGEALAAPDHPWVAKNKATLKKSLEKARASIGELSLIVSPASADVLLNKKPLDKALLAAPIRLDKGPVDVEVRAPGYEPAHDTVTVAGGKKEQRTYTLAAQAPAPVAAAPAGGSVISVVPPAADPGATATIGATPPTPAGPTNHRRIAAWITGGAALGAAVLGTIEAFDAASKRDAFNNHTGVVGGVTIHDCGTASVSPECQPLKDSYDRALTFSIVGFAAAAALAATSSVLFVLSSPGHGGGGERVGVARTFGCVPDPVGRGLGCTLRF